MPNLLDAIRANAQPQQADETGRIQRLLRAKSGKEVGTGDIATSNLGEQQANVQTAETFRTQVLPAAQIQEEAVRGQEAGVQQQVEQQKADVAQSRRFNNIETKLKTNQILQNLEMNKGQLDQQRRDADIAQAAQNLRLQNDQYINNLQREGQRARLDDANAFNEELTRTMFGNSEDLLKKQLGNKSILEASDREWKTAMARMGNEDAYQAFRDGVKADKERAMYTGIGNVVTAGIGAAGTAQNISASNAAAENSAAVSTAQNENRQATSDVNRMKSQKGY